MMLIAVYETDEQAQLALDPLDEPAPRIGRPLPFQSLSRTAASTLCED